MELCVISTCTSRVNRSPRCPRKAFASASSEMSYFYQDTHQSQEYQAAWHFINVARVENRGKHVAGDKTRRMEVARTFEDTRREKCCPTSRAHLYENLIMKIERVSRYIASRQNKIDRTPTGRPDGWIFAEKRLYLGRTAFSSSSYLFISLDCRRITFIGNYRGHGSIRYKDLLRSAAQVRAGRGVTRRPGRT